MSSSNVPVLPLPKTERVNNILQTFKNRFKSSPNFFVRVPGRVNLIGEHIDYCGYAVCPMALEQDIILAVGASSGGDFEVKLVNVDPAYCDFQCDIQNFDINVIDTKPQWYQYFLCGVKGILDTLPKDAPLRGFSVVAEGLIPPAAGLSSSSALVSAAALATAEVQKLSLSKETLASICAKCERYIGTQGGGMDQAIAFLATQGCAKLIEFNPIRATDVTLPSNAVFVIAHSLAQLNKAATSDFNCRVVECRLAAQILAHRKGLSWDFPIKLGEVQKQLGVSLEEMVKLVEETLHGEVYTKEEVAKELGVAVERLEKVSFTENTKDIQQFKLRQRALHVFKEALRVQNFFEKCNTTATAQDEETTLRELGRLMTASHRSLRDDYECSHPQLDRLVELSLGRALGARLTGAGWGGCIVALLHPEQVDGYISLLKREYYADLGVGEGVEKYVFVTAPNAGACVYK